MWCRLRARALVIRWDLLPSPPFWSPNLDQSDTPVHRVSSTADCWTTTDDNGDNAALASPGIRQQKQPTTREWGWRVINGVVPLCLCRFLERNKQSMPGSSTNWKRNASYILIWWFHRRRFRVHTSLRSRYILLRAKQTRHSKQKISVVVFKQPARQKGESVNTLIN